MISCELTPSLAGLEPEWRKLWQRCPEATPFQSPDWLIPWQKHFGEGPLRIFWFRDSGRLIGLAPLYIYSDPSGARRVFLLGCGNSDYLDVLIEPGAESECTRLLLRSLGSIQDEWDECDFQMLRACSPLALLSREPGFRISLTKQENCPVIDLRSPAVRESSLFCRYLELLKELENKTSFEIVPVTSENFDVEFSSLVRLHQSRWEERGQGGAFRDPRVVEFHREAARAFLKESRLRLDFLRVNGKVAASIYGFSERNRVYFYLCGFDAAYAKFSPGTVLIGHWIERAIQDGAVEFDFLRGSEEYKYRWGAKDRPTYRCTIMPLFNRTSVKDRAP